MSATALAPSPWYTCQATPRLLNAGPYWTASSVPLAPGRRNSTLENRGVAARNATPRKFVVSLAATSRSSVPFSIEAPRTRATPRLMYRAGRPR